MGGLTESAQGALLFSAENAAEVCMVKFLRSLPCGEDLGFALDLSAAAVDREQFESAEARERLPGSDLRCLEGPQALEGDTPVVLVLLRI